MTSELGDLFILGLGHDDEPIKVDLISLYSNTCIIQNYIENMQRDN
jgi:hypothetical protein